MSKKTLYEFFKKQGMNDYGASGLMGNIQAESNFKANNVQNNENERLKMNDAEYTKALDNGTFTRDDFVNKHKSGYGLCQWTFPTRKASFYDFMKKNAKSFGDEVAQAKFLVDELKNRYKSVWNTLCNATSVREASNNVLHDFERPADQSKDVEDKRASYGEAIYNEFAKPKVLYRVQVGSYSIKSNAESMMQKLKKAGYDAILVEVK